MPRATGEGTYTVLVTARCQMAVEVHARSKAEAERLASALEYELMKDSDFEPENWQGVRAIPGSARLEGK